MAHCSSQAWPKMSIWKHDTATCSIAAQGMCHIRQRIQHGSAWTSEEGMDFIMWGSWHSFCKRCSQGNCRGHSFRGIVPVGRHLARHEKCILWHGWRVGYSSNVDIRRWSRSSLEYSKNIRATPLQHFEEQPRTYDESINFRSQAPVQSPSLLALPQGET